ncbi:MAG: DUF86 domain-containing protein [Geobacteraceae bacterium]
MSPEVIARKLTKLSQYLEELVPYRNCKHEDFLANHYKIERLIELLVMTASDIAFHLLFTKDEPMPGSYRAAFLRLGEMGLVSRELSRNLALGAGLRNILAHDYEDIDYVLLHASIPQIVEDITAFIQEVVGLP